ncbi:Glucokinase [hydrothermal vent metagenome]|uniref:Glucokinase n=1 Tax=hydrothermal vent metagenome TaxID=652676 RepID=A0A3B0Z427_9ZZZZ
MRILAGDIGGTNTRLVYVQDDIESPVRYDKTFSSMEYGSVVEVVERFLLFYDIKRPLDVACLAVAGPVIAGSASLTNLPWEITEEALRNILQTQQVFLINDLVAAGFAIPSLKEDAILSIIKPSRSEQHSPAVTDAVVIGVGTGLGAAHLVWLGDQYRVFSSEAGHAAFAPGNEVQVRLLSWMQRQQSHISIEWLLSGRGIYTLYQFFRDEVGLPESSSMGDALQVGDPAQLISEHAIAGEDSLCEQTLSCFIDIYAAVVGDIALHHYPLSAVYLVGGIPLKIQLLLMAKKERFAELFCNKGLMHDNLEQLPVKLVVDGATGLDGAIAYARHHFSPLDKG